MTQERNPSHISNREELKGNESLPRNHGFKDLDNKPEERRSKISAH